MKKTRWKNICTFIFMGIFLHALIPLHLPEDINRDRQINIQDAVIMAQNLNSADDRGSESKLSDFISTVQVVAGLKTVIQSQDSDNSAQGGGDLIYIRSNTPCIIKCPTASKFYFVEDHSESVRFAPPIPPPVRTDQA